MPSPDDHATRAIYWQQKTQEWKISELSQIAFCRKHNLNFHRFNYWLRKDKPVKLSKDIVTTKASAFVPVIKTQAIQPGLSLQLPNGCMLQGVEINNLATVKKLMDMLS